MKGQDLLKISEFATAIKKSWSLHTKVCTLYIFFTSSFQFNYKLFLENDLSYLIKQSSSTMQLSKIITNIEQAVLEPTGPNMLWPLKRAGSIQTLFQKGIKSFFLCFANKLWYILFPSSYYYESSQHIWFQCHDQFDWSYNFG